MALFKLNNVGYKNILHYPYLTITKGITTFIAGDSGAGKSTLLKLLNGIISPTQGAIVYRGKNIDEYDQIALRREISLVGQSSFLFNLTIKENFDEYYSYRDLPPISEEQMQFFLQLCAIDFPLDTDCGTMSGGEQQRVFTAINLSFPSEVLMLDEPLSALDEKNANTLMDNIKSYCQQSEKTLIVISHDKTIVEKYADEVINISNERKSV